MSTNPYNDDKRLIELLERWQSGDFSRADEQELLALADSDDFRRETVEGFWTLPETDHAAILSSLRARLGTRSGTGKRVALFPVIAALAAAIALIVAVVWLIPSAEQSTPLAQEIRPESPENQVPTAPSSPRNSDLATSDAEKYARTAPLGKPSADKASSPKPDGIPAASGSTVESEAIATAPMSEIPKEEKIAEQPAAVADELSKFAEVQDDVDPSPGNAAAPARAKKASPAPEKNTDAKKMKTPASANASQPVGGWSNFQDYLRKNARLPEAARQNNVSGSVRLKFSLDENSKPVDFQMLRTLGYGCEEAAIRLIKGYSWQRGDDKALILDIPFVR